MLGIRKVEFEVEYMQEGGTTNLNTTEKKCPGCGVMKSTVLFEEETDMVTYEFYYYPMQE